MKSTPTIKHWSHLCLAAALAAGGQAAQRITTVGELDDYLNGTDRSPRLYAVTGLVVAAYALRNDLL